LRIVNTNNNINSKIIIVDNAGGMKAYVPRFRDKQLFPKEMIQITLTQGQLIFFDTYGYLVIP